MTTTTNRPDLMRSAQWTTVPIESSLKVNAATPLPKNAKSLPKNSALVKVRYASINPVDHKMPEFGPARFAALGKAPWIPACDYSGIVVATNIPGLEPGDRVAGFTNLPAFGTLAEYAVITGIENVTKIPDGVDLKDAATLGIAGQTAMQCIAPFVKKGDHVLINGASGGTGSFGIQIAGILGCVVTAICSGANVELCKQLGATEVIDYKSSDVIEELKKGGQQFDLIIDNVAVAGPVYSESQHYLKKSGLYITIAGAPEMSSLTGLLKMKAQPSWLGGVSRRSQAVGVKADSAELFKLATWVEEGKLKPVIHKVFTLDDAAGAFAMLKKGGVPGKLMIEVSSD